jgi:hypothetical protein
MMRGKQVGGDDPLGGLVVAIDGEGDALVQKGLFASLLAPAQLVRAQLRNASVQVRVMAADGSIRGEHLVIRRPRR